jgi:hypothetical protein
LAQIQSWLTFRPVLVGNLHPVQLICCWPYAISGRWFSFWLLQVWIWLICHNFDCPITNLIPRQRITSYTVKTAKTALVTQVNSRGFLNPPVRLGNYQISMHIHLIAFQLMYIYHDCKHGPFMFLFFPWFCFYIIKYNK